MGLSILLNSLKYQRKRKICYGQYNYHSLLCSSQRKMRELIVDEVRKLSGMIQVSGAGARRGSLNQQGDRIGECLHQQLPSN